MAWRRSVRRCTRAIVDTRAGRAALHALSPDTVAVFLWHSVGSTAAPFFDPQAITDDVSSHCSLEAFASHIGWIRERFRIVPLDEAIETVVTGQRGRGWLAALTFDDGFRNVAEEAVPWLDARGLPCTIFVNSALASREWIKDTDLVYMPEHGQRDRSRAEIARATRAYASWAELRNLPPTVSFGNHGAKHLRLSHATADAARREIDDGLLAMRRELGVDKVPYAFAFGQPSDISEDARAHALQTHTAVFSAFGGSARPGGGREVPRVPVFSTQDPALLAEYTFPPRTIARMFRRDGSA